MLEETLQIYSKYNMFISTLSDDDYINFRNNEDEIDLNEFFSYLSYIDIMRFKIIRPLRNYRNTRSRIFKKFENKKYEIAIRPYFCNDIKNLILSFYEFY